MVARLPAGRRLRADASLAHPTVRGELCSPFPARRLLDQPDHGQVLQAHPVRRRAVGDQRDLGDLLRERFLVQERAVGGDGPDALAPLEPGGQQVGDGLGGGALVLAGADLTDEAGLELPGLGLGVGGPGLLALAARQQVTAGAHDDPPTVATLLDHPPPPSLVALLSRAQG
jgi:hypothetical protein